MVKESPWISYVKAGWVKAADTALGIMPDCALIGYKKEKINLFLIICRKKSQIINLAHMVYRLHY
jgi:hypothetical protein